LPPTAPQVAESSFAGLVGPAQGPSHGPAGTGPPQNLVPERETLGPAPSGQAAGAPFTTLSQVGEAPGGPRLGPAALQPRKGPFRPPLRGHQVRVKRRDAPPGRASGGPRPHGPGSRGFRFGPGPGRGPVRPGGARQHWKFAPRIRAPSRAPLHQALVGPGVNRKGRTNSPGPRVQPRPHRPPTRARRPVNWASFPWPPLTDARGMITLQRARLRGANDGAAPGPGRGSAAPKGSCHAARRGSEPPGGPHGPEPAGDPRLAAGPWRWRGRGFGSLPSPSRFQPRLDDNPRRRR